jgi:hypothetical protein
VSGLDDPYLGGDWESFRTARDRFFARVRPEAMDRPNPSLCPNALPEGWTSDDEREREEHAGA